MASHYSPVNHSRVIIFSSMKDSDELHCKDYNATSLN
jgi:hypothetical protein